MTMSEKNESAGKYEDVRRHMRAAREEMRESVKSLFPPEFIEHRRKARKEMLLAFRRMIDHALERYPE
jgi:signal transduction histidine kinase